MNDLKRPPLGVMPKWLWLEQLEVPQEPSVEESINRRAQVLEAVDRYLQVGLIPNPFDYWE